MTTLQEFKLRHKEAVKEIKEVASKKIKDKKLISTSEDIAKKLIISKQTVINYINGRGKDGYLTEAITKELNSLTK